MENSIEEDIKILEEKMSKELDFLIENANKTEQLTAISIIAMKEPIILLFLSILSDYKRVLKENEELLEVKVSASAHNRILELEKENEELKEYIATAPNLDEMTATKYRNIQQGAYIQGREEGQQKAEQKLKQQIKELQKENEKKDKIIDLMANHIATSDSDLCEYLDITVKCKYYAGDNGKTCDNCIKQYFENKAKEV